MSESGGSASEFDILSNSSLENLDKQLEQVVAIREEISKISGPTSAALSNQPAGVLVEPIPTSPLTAVQMEVPAPSAAEPPTQKFATQEEFQLLTQRVIDLELAFKEYREAEPQPVVNEGACRSGSVSRISTHSSNNASFTYHYLDGIPAPIKVYRENNRGNANCGRRSPGPMYPRESWKNNYRRGRSPSGAPGQSRGFSSPQERNCYSPRYQDRHHEGMFDHPQRFGNELYYPERRLVAEGFVDEMVAMPCVYCNVRHRSDQCPRVSDPVARMDSLEYQGRCTRCLRAYHTANGCKSNVICRYCKLNHHSSICLGPNNVEFTN
ncbi:unnamed protein product [Caenorhabditis sp. 36 PRJEB53466]|nr:unnamed protein product [Caenorhabditis sp. 36 PRJEB53466]